jgi:hypothetical protein
MTVSANSTSGEDTYGITARFTHGGLRLVVENSRDYSLLLIRMDIQYCDGTSEGGDRYGFYHIIIKDGFTFIAEKPLHRVTIYTTVPEVTDNKAYQSIVVTRSCTASSTRSRLYCNNVSFPHEVHRGYNDPISFDGPSYIHRAGLRIPGVDYLILTQRINRYFEYHFYRTISYNYREHRWRGTVPTAKIPVGTYHGVELVVQDGFGNQAKCPVGDLTVLP